MHLIDDLIFEGPRGFGACVDRQSDIFGLEHDAPGGLLAGVYGALPGAGAVNFVGRLLRSLWVMADFQGIRIKQRFIWIKAVSGIVHIFNETGLATRFPRRVERPIRPPSAVVIINGSCDAFSCQVGCRDGL